MPAPNGKLFQLLSARDLNILRGKAMAGAITPDEALAALNHVAVLEDKLDAADKGDALGPDGWRNAFEIPED